MSQQPPQDRARGPQVPPPYLRGGTSHQGHPGYPPQSPDMRPPNGRPHPGPQQPPAYPHQSQSGPQSPHGSYGQHGVPGSQRPGGSGLADGEWHRVDPLTPMASAMIALGVAIPAGLAFVIPIAMASLAASGTTGSGRGVSVGLFGAIAMVAAFGFAIVWPFIAYRFTEFRVGDDVFEFRSGVLTKQQRQVRLDRLQSVNLNRTLGARVFGLSVLETSGAGSDSDIKLQYLKKEEAERLRAELLQRASGARRARTEAQLAGAPVGSHPAPVGAPAGAAPMGMPVPQPAPRQRRTLADFVDAAVLDFSTFDQEQGAEHPVVRVSPRRIAITTMLQFGVIIVLLLAIFAVPAAILLPQLIDDSSTAAFATFGVLAGIIVPLVFAMIVAGASSLMQNLQYTIAGTPDGIRVGHGVVSQNSDTVAPGRIHSVQVNQPFYWRPFGWYSLTVNRADLQQQADTDKDDQQLNSQRHTLLPVGTLDEVARVLQLVLPMHMSEHTLALIGDGMSAGRSPAFVAAPARAWWMRPFGFRRYGYAIDRGVMYLRSGWLFRRLAVIPGERMQGVTVRTGPVRRMVGVVTISPDTVGGPVRTQLPLVDAADARGLFERVERLGLETAAADTSHRWREAQARLSVAAAHMEMVDAAKSGRAPSPQAAAVVRAENEWRRSAGLPPEPVDTAAESVGENQLPPLPPTGGMR